MASAQHSTPVEPEAGLSADSGGSRGRALMNPIHVSRIGEGTCRDFGF
jgi:hypothetical protein